MKNVSLGSRIIRKNEDACPRRPLLSRGTINILSFANAQEIETANCDHRSTKQLSAGARLYKFYDNSRTSDHFLMFLDSF